MDLKRQKGFEMSLRLSHKLVIAKACCYWTDSSSPTSILEKCEVLPNSTDSKARQVQNLNLV